MTRVVIVPWADSSYDRRMTLALARGFRACGVEAVAFSSHPGPKVSSLCAAFDADVLFQINRLRPDDLPRNIRHVSWFQDPPIPSSAEDHFYDGDLIYTLSDANGLSLKHLATCHTGYLYLAADYDGSSVESGERDRIDFSVCGYIPPPRQFTLSRKTDLAWRIAHRIDDIPLGRRITSRLRRKYDVQALPPHEQLLLHKFVELHFEPLTGNLHLNEMARGLDYVSPRVKNLPESKRKSLDPIIVEYILTSARLLDRERLANELIEISPSVEFYGRGWRHHPIFAPFYKREIVVQRELLDVYRQTKLNCSNHPFGFGMHARTFDVMAAGGFFFFHSSEQDAINGGMHTVFEPQKHYGTFNPWNIREEAARWLRDEKRRRDAAEAACTLVRGNHLWRHRAVQVLSDLGIRT